MRVSSESGRTCAAVVCRSPIQNGSIAAAHSARETPAPPPVLWLVVGFCVLLAFVGLRVEHADRRAYATESTSVRRGIGGQNRSCDRIVSEYRRSKSDHAGSTSRPAFKLTSPASLPVTVAGSTYNFRCSSNLPARRTTGQVTFDQQRGRGWVADGTLSGLGVQSATAATASVLSGVSCNNSTWSSGADNCFVALNGPAGSGGLTVDLSSSNPAVSVPATVTIPANYHRRRFCGEGGSGQFSQAMCSQQRKAACRRLSLSNGCGAAHP